MDEVFAAIRRDTSKFNLGDEEIWRELYEPFIPSPHPDITLTSNLRYGPESRNLLDVYIPASKEPNKPVLLYVHGGGFFSGDKAWSKKCWGNVGYFFAQRGIVTVTANHQFVPRPDGPVETGEKKVRYPDGADDMQAIREWIYGNIASEKYGSGSVDKVVLLGHSSGGAHIAMNLYAAGDPARVPKQAIFPPVAGVMYFSVPFWFDRTKSIRQKTIRNYYGSDAEEAWRSRCALGLLEGLPDDSPLFNSDELPTYIGTVQWEVKEACDGAIAFFNAYRARSQPAGTLPSFHVLEKHNHLSNMLSIGTEDTSQSTRILEFIQSCVDKIDSKEKSAVPEKSKMSKSKL